MARNRALLGAIFISVAFHLSAVTLFRIVVLFPREDIAYYEVALVESGAAGSLQRRLEVPAASNALTRLADSDAPDAADRWAGLPKVQLPVLAFPELELIRSGQEALDTRRRYREMFSEDDDSWAKFSKGLASVGSALGRFAEGLIRQDDQDSSAPVSRPAPGFEAYLEWMDEPKSRRILTVARIEALWGYDKSALSEPIALVFRVDRSGRVTEVLAPIEDEDGIVDGAAAALFQYRFEPIGASGPEEQHGTLIIGASDD